MHTHLRAGGFNAVASRSFARTTFTPLSLSPALWLDASDSSTLYQDSALTTLAAADGDPVGGWKDKSGNNRHATQGTSSARPTLKLGLQNGKPVVRLDGVDDYLSIASNLFGVAETTSFFVFKRTGNQFGGIITSKQSGVETAPAIDLENTGQLRLVYQGAGAVTQGSASTLSTCFVFLAHITRTAGAELYVNGGAANTTASWSVTAASPAATNQIGTYRVETSNYAKGDLSELIVCTGALTNTQANAALAYLGAKWGLSVANI